MAPAYLALLVICVTISAQKVSVPPHMKYSNGIFYHYNATEVTWKDAANLCSKDGGYLLDESAPQSVLDDLIANMHPDCMWVAMKKLNGFFQWVGRNAEYKRENLWSWHPKEPNLKNGGDCVKLMSPKFELSPPLLHTEECNMVLPFACLYQPEDIKITRTYENAQAQMTPADDHLVLDMSEFHNLTLRCELSGPGQVSWVKDGVYMQQHAPVLQPTTYNDITRRMSTPGTLYSRQGRYWCEGWFPGRLERVRSNAVLVELENILNAVVMTSHVLTNNDISSIVPKKVTRQMRRKGINLTTAGEWDFSHSDYREFSQGVIVNHWYYLHVNLTVNDCKNQLLEWVWSGFMSDYVFGTLKYLNTSAFYFLTVCSNETGEYEWPIAEDGMTVVPSDALCVTDKHQVLARQCKWGFPSAKWSKFDPHECTYRRAYLHHACPYGYQQYNNNTCAKVITADTWSGAFQSCVSSGLEVSPFDMDLTFKNASVWLPYQRIVSGGPLTYIGITYTDINTGDYPLTDMFNASWESGEPKRNYDCLAMNPNRTLFAADCNSKYNYACVLEVNDANNETYDCQPGWSSNSLVPRHNKCYKEFKNVTWKEANDVCRKHDSSPLHVRSSGYFNTTTWLNLINHNGTMYDMQGDLLLPETMAWDPSLDLSKQYGISRMGLVSLNDDIVSNVICERERPSYMSYIHTVLDDRELTVTVSPDMHMFRCFHDGFLFYKCSGTCLDHLHVSEQGYYQCDAFSASSLTYIKSAPVLYVKKNTYTFLVHVLDRSDVYRPEKHDFTFGVPSYGHNLSVHVSDFLMPLMQANVTMTVTNLASDANGLLATLRLEIDYDPVSNTPNERMVWTTLSELVNSTVGSTEVLSIRSTITCPGGPLTIAGVPPKTVTLQETPVDRYSVPEQPCLNSDGKPVLFKCRGSLNHGAGWEYDGQCDGDPSSITVGLSAGNVELAKELTSDPGKLNPIDVHYATRLLEAMSDGKQISHVNMDDSFSLVRNLVRVNYDKLVTSQELLNTSNRIVSAAEAITLSGTVPEDGNVNGNSYKSEREHVSYEVWDLEKPEVIGFSSNPEGEVIRINTLYRDNINLHPDTTAALILPETLVDNITAGTVRISFVVYNESTLFDTVRNRSGMVVNAPVVQASIRDRAIRDVTPAIKILFKPRLAVDEDPTCVFWDFEANGGNGEWSQDGCQYAGHEDGKDVCLCNHLTSFAELISYYGEDGESAIDPSHRFVLDLITIIGCSISILGLCLVFTTFMLFPRWRKPLGNRIIVNLSFALFSVYVIFLAGIHQTWNPILCGTVAATLHYFILATFCWMFVEATHQYLRFVKVIGTYIPRFMWKAGLSAWGCPFVPVIAVLATDPSQYTSGQSYCWMSPDAFLYAFLIPLFAILAVNTAIFGMIIHGIFCQRANLRCNQQQYRLAVTQLRMAVCVFVLLGLTWLFGAFAIGGARILFTYLFCVFNTLQGFLIFAFHVLRERTSTNLWRGFFSVCGCGGTNEQQSGVNSRFSSAQDPLFKRDGRYIPVLPRHADSTFMMSRRSNLS